MAASKMRPRGMKMSGTIANDGHDEEDRDDDPGRRQADPWIAPSPGRGEADQHNERTGRHDHALERACGIRQARRVVNVVTLGRPGEENPTSEQPGDEQEADADVGELEQQGQRVHTSARDWHMSAGSGR